MRNWHWPCLGASSWTPRGAAGIHFSAPVATAPRPPPPAALRTPSPPKVGGSLGFPAGLPEQCQVRTGGLPAGRRQKSVQTPSSILEFLGGDPSVIVRWLPPKEVARRSQLCWFFTFRVQGSSHMNTRCY